MGQAILTDRLGSVGGPSKYYPYRQERQTTPQDTEKFATYYRDATGLDYAWNRHYTSTWGRFMQADPYLSPDALKNPQGWNRYVYAVGDPVNNYDPWGLLISVPALLPALTPVINLITEIAGSARDLLGGGEASRTVEFDANDADVITGEVGGAGVAGYQIKVLGFSKSGPEQEVIVRGLREILEQIDEDCAKRLGDGYEPYVRGLLRKGSDGLLIGHGVFEGRPLVAAISSTAHTNVDAGEAAIVINRAGAFFNAAIGGQKVLVSGGRYTEGSSAAQVFILLHEIAHGLAKLRPDFDDPAAVKGNDDLIWDKCQKTLRRFP